MRRFEGESLEAALGAAVAGLGSELQVVDARRVRRGGVLGFFARETYEVIAQPSAALAMTAAPAAVPAPPAALPAANPLDTTLQSLVEQIEAAERPMDFEAAPALPQLGALTPLTVDLTDPSVDLRPPDETPTFYDFEADEEVVEVVGIDLPVLESPEEVIVAIDGEPAWSRAALRELGLPAEIMRYLAAEDPGTDLAWTAALERAIHHVAPTAGMVDGARLSVNGVGAESAIDLLQAAIAGFTPGQLVLEGRQVAATPTWLAMAVRACLVR